jgi:hypothetical protein
MLTDRFRFIDSGGAAASQWERSSLAAEAGRGGAYKSQGVPNNAMVALIIAENCSFLE